MGSLNRKRSMGSNDASASIVMKRLLRRCMTLLEKECRQHAWNCTCDKCTILREITREI